MENIVERYMELKKQEAEYEKAKAVFESRVESAAHVVISRVTSLDRKSLELIKAIKPDFNIESEKLSDLNYLNNVLNVFREIEREAAIICDRLLSEAENAKGTNRVR